MDEVGYSSMLSSGPRSFKLFLGQLAGSPPGQWSQFDDTPLLGDGDKRLPTEREGIPVVSGWTEISEDMEPKASLGSTHDKHTGYVSTYMPK